MAWSQEKVDATLASVQLRATTDRAFRQLALTDPLAAVEAVAGERPSASFKLRVVENAGAHLTLVLPDFQEAVGELDDDDLELVAGGGGRPGKISGTSNVNLVGYCF